MNILLSNDDGYNEEGLLLLKELLKNYGTVYVVAPSVVKSGASASFTLGKRMKLIKYDDFNYALEGTPVDCVSFGLNGLGVKFDLVVSGCNNGFNLSFDAVYSGTIGACFQSLVNRIPTFAFSTQVDNFKIVKKYGKEVIDYIFKNDLLSNNHILNINFPVIEYESIKGIKITKQHFRTIEYSYHINEDGVRCLREIIDEGKDDDLDTIAVQEGFVSITPLARSSFSEELYKKIKEKRNVYENL